MTPTQVRELARQTVEATSMDANTKRSLLKSILTTVEADADKFFSSLSHEEEDIGSRAGRDESLRALEKESDRNLNQIADFQNWEPIVILIGCQIECLADAMADPKGYPKHYYDSMGRMYEAIRCSIEQPSAFSKRNTRAKSGYSYAYPSYWEIEPAIENLKLRADPEVGSHWYEITESPKDDDTTEDEPSMTNLIAATEAALVRIARDDTLKPALQKVFHDCGWTDPVVVPDAGLVFDCAVENMREHIASGYITDEDYENGLLADCPDRLALLAIISLGLNEDEEEEPEPVPVTFSPPPVDANLSSAVNQLLGSATGDQVTSIEDLLASEAEARTKVLALESKLASATQELLAAPTIASAESPALLDMDGVSFSIASKKASGIFKSPSNRKMKGLAFDVPVLQWKDDKGKKIVNPQVPKIDEAYAFRPEMLMKFLAAISKHHNVWAHGHTGTGKTTFFEQVAARLGVPFFRLNLDSNLERADLVGQITLTQDGGATITRFDEGVLPQAMQQPAWLCFDECDSGRPDILFVLQRALEKQGLMLTEDGGRIVKPHPSFRFVATANSRGQGDEFGVYSGVRQMNAAFMNRWDTLIEVPYLNKGDETKLLLKKFPKLVKEKAEQLAQFGVEVRKAFVNGEVSLPLSPRDLFATVDMWAFFTLDHSLMTEEKAWDMALEMSILDKAPSDNKQRIIELKQRCITHE